MNKKIYSKEMKEIIEDSFRGLLSYLVPKADYYAPSNLRREHESKDAYDFYDWFIQEIIDQYITIFDEELQERFFSNECEWLDEDSAFDKFERDYQERASEEAYSTLTD